MIEDKARKIKRSEIWNKIYTVVSQIPREKTSNDAMDYASASTLIEELLQTNQERERELLKFIGKIRHNPSECEEGLTVPLFMGRNEYKEFVKLIQKLKNND